MGLSSITNDLNILYNAGEFFYNVNVPANIFSNGNIDLANIFSNGNIDLMVILI